MSTMLEEIERMVSKSPGHRTDEEVNKLLPWFRKKSDVFSSLKPDAVVDIIRNCEMIRRPKDSIIIKQGDKGNCFFIILSGKVSVHISTKDDDDEVDEESRPQNEAELTQALGLPVKRHSIVLTGSTSPNKTVSRRLSTSRNGSEKSDKKVEAEAKQSSSKSDTDKRHTNSNSETVIEAFHQSNTQVTDRPKYGQYVATVGDGKSFGELALLKKDCIRNATIITDSNTRLLIVNRQLYNRCIRESQEKEFQAKQLFVHTSEYFEGWTLKSKRQLAMSLQLRTYSYGTPVVCQGHPVDYIYFLQSGQCRVIVDPSHHRNQYPSYHAVLDKISTKRFQSQTEDYRPAQIVRRGRRRRYSLHGYDICLIGSFNMIGDIELSTNLSTYMQSVICEQQTEAFAIDLRNYDRLVTRRHAFTGRLIAQNALLKLSNRALRFQHIPLLSAVVKKYYNQHREYKHRPHYLGYQKQRQLNKSRFLSPQNSLPLLGKLKDQKVDQNNEAKERAPLCAIVSYKAVPPPRSDTARLHQHEEKRMNKLEAKIIAFHGNLEKEKEKYLAVVADPHIWNFLQ